MPTHLLDPYRPGRSLLHGLDPRLKFVLALAFILTVVTLPDGAWPIFVLMLSLTLSAAVVAELGVGFVLRRALVALPFTLAAVGVLFTLPGPALWQGTLGPWTLTLSRSGLERFVTILLKSWLSVQAAILLTATTPFPRIVQAMRALHLPRLLVAIFALMWRYLFLLVNQAQQMMLARAARSADPTGRGGGRVIWQAQVTGHMAGSLFLRGFERGERVYAAMLARGYDGEVRGFPLPPIAARQVVVSVGLVALWVALALLAHWVW